MVSTRLSREWLFLSLLAAGLGASLMAAVTIGQASIPPGEAWRLILGVHSKIENAAVWSDILLAVRLPRVLLGAAVGGSLATSGCAMQGLFRNPMASPYVLGVASAAALGASLVLLFGLDGFWMVPAAFAMGLGGALTAYGMARIGRRVPVGTLLLSGIALSLFFSALVSFAQYLADDQQLRRIVFWLMGGLWDATWRKLILCALCGGLALVGLIYFARDLNLLLEGEVTAADLGVEVEKVRLWVLCLATLAVSAAVAIAGVVGFVGLIVPHAMRLLVGPDHRLLLPASALGGGLLLVWTDTLARSLAAPVEIPVGILTALLGVPFFLYLLRSRRRISGL